MPEFQTDADLVIQSVAPEWLSAHDRIIWRLSDVPSRRRLLNEARWAQVEDTRRHEESKRRAEARQPIQVPTIPNAEQCREMVLAHPGLYAQVSERARNAFNRVRRMEGAPLRALDHRWEQFRRDLNGQPSWRQLQIVTECEAYFISEANADDLSHRGWLEAEAARVATQQHAAEVNCLQGRSFDPGRFVAQLSAKGVQLVANGSGDAIRGAGNLSNLTQADRDAIAAHKADLVDFLQRMEQLA